MNYDDENEIIEQENKGQQQFDPIGTYQNIKEIDRIGKRIKDSKLKNKGNDEVDISPKTGGAEKAVEEGTKKAASGTAGTEGVASGGIKAAEAGTNATGAAAGAGSAGAGAGAAAGAGSAGAGAGAAAGAGSAGAGVGAAASGTPVGLIIIGIVAIVAVIFLLLLAVFMGSAGSGMSIGTGGDENIWSFTCEDGDEKCEEVKQYLKGEYSGLGKRELYDKFLELCDEKKSFGKRIADFFSNLLGTDEYPELETSCDLAQLINKYVTDKEKESNVRLSRGLVVATIQWLYENVVIGDDSEKNSDLNNLNTSSPNDVLENILKNGMINARDVKSIVDYMVFDVNYTFYNWQETYKNTEYDCKTNSDGTRKCKTLIKYGCFPSTQKMQYTSPEKYFYFLRFGGSFIIDENKLIWNKTTLENDKIIITDKYNVKHDDLTDFATSYQEIKNFNDAYNSSSDSCKIDGLAKVPESTADVIYELDTPSVNHALEVLKEGLVDTEAYDQISLKNIANVEGSIDMPVVKTNCQYKFNNGVDSNSIKCVEIKSTSYYDGFIYRRYPKYTYANDDFSTPDLTGKEYNDIARSIEGNIEFLDLYEEFLNDIFGFGEIITGNMGFISSCMQDEALRIRLQTCSSSTEKEKSDMSKQFPGGASIINGNYVANDTLTVDQYIKGVARAESENLFHQEKIEALKFQLIAIKSYFLSNKENSDNGEIIMNVGSSCAQNYKSLDNLDTRYSSILDNAYDLIKSILLYTKDTNEIFSAEYGAEFTNYLEEYANQGYKYTDMITMSNIVNYPKANYSNATFNSCSSTTQMGFDLITNAMQFLKGGSHSSGGWMNRDFINSQYRSTCDFHSGSPWCARFTNLIKELTPEVATKVGKVNGQAGVYGWMRHFSNTPGLTFYSSNSFSSVGFYQNGVKYSYTNGVYRPKAGDFIFYAWSTDNGDPWNKNPNNSSGQDHIALIIDVYDRGNQTCLKTIEGNVSGNGNSDASWVQIWDCKYNTNHSSVIGYGAWE